MSSYDANRTSVEAEEIRWRHVNPENDLHQAELGEGSEWPDTFPPEANCRICGATIEHDLDSLFDIFDFEGLQGDLEELERTDPAVRAAALQYEAVKRDIVKGARERHRGIDKLCPMCGAEPGQPCTNIDTEPVGAIRARSHFYRGGVAT